MSKVIIVSLEDLKALIRSELEEVFRLVSEVAAIPHVEDNVFMNVNEAAAFLHKKPSTIYHLVQNRTVPVYKRGNRLLFKKAELQQWFYQFKQKTNDEIVEIAKQRNK